MSEPEISELQQERDHYRDETAWLRAERATIAARVQFLLGFIDASDPKSIVLSSEHSVGEQILKLAKLVKGRAE